MVYRERLLKVREIAARLLDQPVYVEQCVARASLIDRESFQRHRFADQLRDAGCSRTAAQKQKALLSKLLPGNTQRAENARQCDGGRALDIVVIRAELVLVAIEQWHRVEVREVFPLDAAFRKQRLNGFDEFVDERVVVVAAHP